MLSRNTLKHLTEDELSMVLYILNTYYSSPFFEVDFSILITYKNHIFEERILSVKDKITEEGLPIYNSLCEKLFKKSN